VALPNKPTFQWRIRQYTDGIHREMLKRTYRAAELVKNQTQRNISKSAIIQAKPRRYEHSHPGEYPRAITGLLRNSIAVKIEAASLRGWVYSNLLYSLFLEYSTKFIKDRSFLRRTLVEMLSQVRAIYQKPLPSNLAGGGKLLVGK
jgi:hypothetical protein